MLKQSGAYPRAFGEFVTEQFKADWLGQGCAHMWGFKIKGSVRPHAGTLFILRIPLKDFC